MPRRSIPSAAERKSLPALPDANDDLLRHTFNDTDLYIIRQHRGATPATGLTYFAVRFLRPTPRSI